MQCMQYCDYLNIRAMIAILNGSGASDPARDLPDIKARDLPWDAFLFNVRRRLQRCSPCVPSIDVEVSSPFMMFSPLFPFM